MAKNTKTENPFVAPALDSDKWREVESSTSGDRPTVEMLDGSQCVGRVVQGVKVVTAEYEGEKNPRCLLVVEVDGEAHNLWLPAMMESDLRHAKVGKWIHVTRTGSGKRDTRYRLRVAG